MSKQIDLWKLAKKINKMVKKWPKWKKDAADLYMKFESSDPRFNKGK